MEDTPYTLRMSEASSVFLAFSTVTLIATPLGQTDLAIGLQARGTWNPAELPIPPILSPAIRAALERHYCAAEWNKHSVGKAIVT